MKKFRKIIAVMLAFLLFVSAATMNVSSAENDASKKLDKLVGVFVGEYTASQGITSLELIICKKDDLLNDISKLKYIADIACACDGPEQDFSEKDIYETVKRHEGDYIAFYHYYPTKSNPGVEEGLYTTTVTYNQDTDTYDFIGSEWIQHDRYVFAHLIGLKLSKSELSGGVYYGTSENEKCGDVKITQSTGKTVYRIEFNFGSVALGINEEKSVKAIVYDENRNPADKATNITWTSSDTSVATVEGENWKGNGTKTASAKIKGVSSGIATIYATIENQRFDSFEVVVSDGGVSLPLELKLSYEMISSLNKSKTGSETAYTYQPQFRIIAQAKNNGSNSAEDVVLTLNMPDNMKLTDENASVEQISSSIAPGSIKEFSWKVSIDVEPEGNQFVKYSVRANDNNSVGTIKYQTLFIEPFVPGNNTLDLKIDTWNFSNSDNYFVNGYHINDKYYQPLINAVSNVEKEMINETIDSDWGGSCFGMCLGVSLNKLGKVDIGELDNNASCLYDLSIENDDVYSFINYYHVLQKLDVYSAYIDNQFKLTEKELLQGFVDETEKVGNGGMPVILLVNYTNKDYDIHSIDNDVSGHALVAYNVEHGSFKEKELIGGAQRTYPIRVSIYDPNSADKETPIYMYIDVENGKWMLGDRCQNRTKDDLLWYAKEGGMLYISDGSLFDLMNISDVRKNYTASLVTRHQTNLTIHNKTIDDYIINGPNVVKGRENVSAYVFANGENNATETEYFLSDGESTHEITPDKSAKKTDLSFSYANSSFSAKADNTNKITFVENESVTMQTDGGTYTISTTFNDGYTSTPWYTCTASGKDSSEIGLRLENAETMFLSGSNLNGVDISVNGNNLALSGTVYTDEKDVMITSTQTELEFYIDADKDGVYETKLSDDQSANSKKTVAIIIIAVTVAFGIFVAVAPAIVLKKRKKKQKEEE